ncbi:MAG: MATE family efflux transporter [Deltaproteobacteria bacterium]|nr:MATE family efflux transporter [Deltaproteobacteria bacterium]|tara:strand:+ start:5415 stop:6734 length:1320 start_codon:yes stop_codon:yes gene_type:complete
MNREVLRLAIPNILSNLSIPLLSSVDTALVGHLNGVHYIGAIAVGGAILNMVYWGFSFLRMGTTGPTAQAHGSQDREEEASQFGRAICVALFFGVLLILLQDLVFWAGLSIMKASPLVEKHARIYLSIRIYAAPATLSLLVMHGWFLGMQNARFPLYLALTSNAFNIGLNLYFVKVMGMKSDGIALGTLIAQYTALSVGVGLIVLRYRPTLRHLKFENIIKWSALQKLFSINRDIFLRTLALIFVFTYFTAQSAQFGDAFLAANAVLQQFWLLTAYGIDGFSDAAESLVGKYLGAKRIEKIQVAIKYVFAWGFALAFVLMLVFGLGKMHLLSLFTDQPKVLEIANTYFIWTLFVPLLSCLAFLWDGVYLGATRTDLLRNTMFIAAFVVFYPLFRLTYPYLGNHALWLAMTAFMVTRGIALSLLATKHFFGARPLSLPAR